MKRILSLALALFLAGIAIGCGESDPTPQGKTDEASIQVISLEVALSGSSIQISNLRQLEVPRARSPIDSLGGELMVVSYSHGKVRQAMPFRLPTVAHVDGRGEAGRVGETIPISGGSVTLLLDATEPLDRIEVLDEFATVLASVGSDELAKTTQANRSGKLRWMAVTPPERMTPLGRLEAEFPEIRFLDPAYGDTLAPIFADAGNIVGLGSYDDAAADALIEALHRIPSAAMGAVRTVGVAQMSINELWGVSYGGTLLLAQHKVGSGADFVATAVHEATHNFQFLVDGGFRLALNNPDVWPPDVRAAADETINKFALQSGVTSAWAALHETGVDLGVSGSYTGADGWRSATELTACQAGFASPYGSSEPAEDMAEYVFRVRVPENADGEAPVCLSMRTAGDPFPSRLAVPLAKVKFLEALGLLDAADATKCIGNPAIKGPPGIHLGDTIGFSSDLKAGWLDQDGGHFLSVSGSALPYRFMVRVLAPNNRVLGIHRLDTIGFFNINQPNNAAYLAHEENLLLARTSAGGLVLVTAANAELVEGVIFLLSLKSAAGFITDAFPLGTFSFPSS